MPVDGSLKTEIDSAITEAAEVATEAAAFASASASASAEETATEGQVDDQAAAQIDAAAAEEVEVAAEAEADAEAEAIAEAEESVEGKVTKSLAPAKPTISDYALIQASRVGIDADAARRFPDEASLLGAVINILDRTREVNEEAEQEEDAFAEFPELDPEVYEPEAIQMFSAMKDILQKQNDKIQSLQSQHEQVAVNNQQASAVEVERWFDSQIGSLGEDFADALGTGGYSSLDRGGSQFAKRDAIASQMAVLLAGYQAAGIQVPSREKVFDFAVKIVLHDEFRGLSEKKLASSLSKRSKQHISRANGQTSKSTKSPQDETAALLDEQFFSKG